MGTISVKQFGLRSAWCFVWPNLYPICLQILPADNKKPHKMEKSYTILFSFVTGFLFQNLEVYNDFTFIACLNVLDDSRPRSPVEAAWSGSTLFAYTLTSVNIIRKYLKQATIFRFNFCRRFNG